MDFELAEGHETSDGDEIFEPVTPRIRHLVSEMWHYTLTAEVTAYCGVSGRHFVLLFAPPGPDAVECRTCHELQAEGVTVSGS